MTAFLLYRRKLALAILHKLRPAAGPLAKWRSPAVAAPLNKWRRDPAVLTPMTKWRRGPGRTSSDWRDGCDQLEPMSSRPGQAIFVDNRPGAAEIGVQLDPFFTTWNMRDKMLEDGPYGAAVAEGVASCLRRDFEEREDDEGMYVRLDMPGLGKENVEVWVEGDSVVFRGGGPEENGRRYGGRIHLEKKLFKTDKTKVEMKNGVLKIMVPKVTGVERANICRKLNIE